MHFWNGFLGAEDNEEEPLAPEEQQELWRNAGKVSRAETTLGKTLIYDRRCKNDVTKNICSAPTRDEQQQRSAARGVGLLHPGQGRGQELLLLILGQPGSGFTLPMFKVNKV